MGRPKASSKFKVQLRVELKELGHRVQEMQGRVYKSGKKKVDKVRFRFRIMSKRGKDQPKLMHKLRARTEHRMKISLLNNKSINQV